MLSDAERKVLNRALEKYHPGQSEPILVGGGDVLKPALRLMTSCLLMIEEIKDSQAITSYTRWVDAVEEKVGENRVYVTFSPRFVRIWVESKKCLLEYVAQKPGNAGLRSRYALRMYSWAKKYVTVGSRRIPLEQLRKVLGLVSVKDAGRKYHQRSTVTHLGEPRDRALGRMGWENGASALSGDPTCARAYTILT
jgi:hypothetical protein